MAVVMTSAEGGGAAMIWLGSVAMRRARMLREPKNCMVDG